MAKDHAPQRWTTFSSDGYIIDQRGTGHLKYGKFSSEFNGCGWIAAYNLLHALRFDITEMQVHDEMSAILPYHGMAGTPTKTFCRYLDQKNVLFDLITGKQKALVACKQSNAGVLRYFEGNEIHYVTFTRISQANFRFFNAIMGKAQHITTMDHFFNTRCKIPVVKAIVVK